MQIVFFYSSSNWYTFYFKTKLFKCISNYRCNLYKITHKLYYLHDMYTYIDTIYRSKLNNKVKQTHHLITDKRNFKFFVN